MAPTAVRRGVGRLGVALNLVELPLKIVSFRGALGHRAVGGAVGALMVGYSRQVPDQA
jgi:hypothetical protein